MFVLPFRRVLTRRPLSRSLAALEALAFAIGRCGSISLVQWYIDTLHFPSRYSLAVGAAHGNHLPLLRWLHKECRLLPCEDSGHYKPVPWRCSCVVQAAVKRGHIPVLEWALSIGDVPVDCHALAVEFGQLEVLRRLEHVGRVGLPVRPKYAAQVGNLEMLQYLNALGILFDEECCAAAAEGGHLDVLVWCVSKALDG